jgi:hypothetical protein
MWNTVMVAKAMMSEVQRNTGEPPAMCRSNRPKGARHHRADGRLSQRTEHQARHGDAELARRQIAVEVVEHVAGHARRETPLVCQLVDTAAPHGHQRELRRDEETIDQHEQQGGASRQITPNKSSAGYSAMRVFVA